MVQPYVIPDLYRPYPARSNVNVQAARARGKEWATGAGMLGGPPGRPLGAWSETEFDALDPGLLSACAHPDASAPELELLTQWYIWLFFFTGHSRRAFRSPAECGDRLPRLLFRLLSCVLEGDASPRPCSESPAERGLADLWPRTAALAPRRWTEAFAAATRALIRAEADRLHAAHRGVPDLLTLFARRRTCGAATWATHLVGLVRPGEPPERIERTPRFTSLQACFSDATHLANDLYSYRKGTPDNAVLYNAVLSAERFLRCTAQEAADRVNGLRTARMRRFEEIAATQAPAWQADHALAPGECQAVAAYVKGLQDWQAGVVEWHRRSGRSRAPEPVPSPRPSASPPLPLTRSSSPSLLTPSPSSSPSSFSSFPSSPPFDLPWAYRINTHVGTARRRARRWAREVGLIPPAPSASPNSPTPPIWVSPAPPVWTEEAFGADDRGLFAALTHPDAAEDELCRAALWHVCLTAFDDHFATAFKDRRDATGARAFVRRLPGLMPLDGAPPITPANRVEGALADLWSRTFPELPEELRLRFPSYVVDYVGSNLWELDTIIKGRAPDPVEYLEKRRTTSGTDLCLALTPHSPDQALPAALLHTRPVRTLREAFADTVGIRNAVHSYRTEAEEEGEVSNKAANRVSAIQRFLDCAPHEAVDVAHALFQARVTDFQEAEASLPALLDGLSLSSDEREAVHRHVDALKAWMAGDNEWHRRTGRYTRRSRPRLAPPGLSRPRPPVTVNGSYARPLTL